jgi:PHD/YefM family antitoxin component YafN of YafNO toxin-antitoxin module
MIELTEQQRQELNALEPVAIDPQTRTEYVLVRREVYQRMRAELDDYEPDMRALSRLVERNMQEDDANDPLLESYQDSEDHP